MGCNRGWKEKRAEVVSNISWCKAVNVFYNSAPSSQILYSRARKEDDRLQEYVCRLSAWEHLHFIPQGDTGLTWPVGP